MRRPRDDESAANRCQRCRDSDLTALKDAAVINAEFLHRLFPRADEIPLEHRPLAAIHRRRVLINCCISDSGSVPGVGG
jgi:hypothetical protein